MYRRRARRWTSRGADSDAIPCARPCGPPGLRRRALHFAAAAGHLAIIRRLLESGADPLEGFFHNFPVPSAISLAHQHGHYEALQLMERHVLEYRAPAQTDADGNTLLHLAIYHRSRSMTEALLSRGVPVDPLNAMGQRPIHLALYNGMGGPMAMLRPPSYDLAGLLVGDVPGVRRHLDNDPALNRFDSGARRYPRGINYPLGIACLNGHIDVVRVLLAAGADPDLKQDNEYRENDILESGVPLILSIAAGHLAIAHLLLDHGAQAANTFIHSGPNAWSVASDCGDEALVRRLVIQGARPPL